MKKYMSKLHKQIIIALILGAIFGSIFNVNKYLLSIKYKINGEVETTIIEDWEKVSFLKGTDDVKIYDKNSQLEIIKTYEKLKKNNQKFSLMVSGFLIDDSDEKIESQVFENVVKIEKQNTIAVQIKWIGTIFIRLLTMIAIPLVLASLLVGTASLGDIKKFTRIGGKTITWYITTTIFAIVIGVILTNLIKPGEMITDETKTRLVSVYREDAAEKVSADFEYSFIDEIVNFVPKNPFFSLSNGEMLQIIIFAIFLGLALSMVSQEKAKYVIGFFEGLSEAMIKLVDIIMWIAPFGVFALIAAVVGEFGFDVLFTLISYAGTVLAGLIIHTFIIYPVILKIFTKVNVFDFFRNMRDAQTIAFSTSSSAATLPVTMETCIEKLGVPKQIANFTLPLGATINMDGTALYQGVAAIFIAQVYGLDLNLIEQLIVIFTALMASIGSAPVPAVGIVMLAIILRSVGIPEEGIALIIGVDRILDMCRTVTNVTGDAVVTLVIASKENKI